MQRNLFSIMVSCKPEGIIHDWMSQHQKEFANPLLLKVPSPRICVLEIGDSFALEGMYKHPQLQDNLKKVIADIKLSKFKLTVEKAERLGKPGQENILVLKLKQTNDAIFSLHQRLKKSLEQLLNILTYTQK